MRYSATVRSSVLAIFGLGMIILGIMFLASMNGNSLYCLAVALVSVLLLISIWRFTGRSTLELNGRGITQVGWWGTRRQWAWEDIGKVTYSHIAGQLTLWHQHGKQREFFMVLPLLLTHYCPTLWRIHEPRIFRPALPIWVQALLIGALNVGAWLWLAVWTTPQPFTFVVLIGFAALSVSLLWNVTKSLTITPTTLVLEKRRQHRKIPIKRIAEVSFSAANRQGLLHFSPTVLLENEEFIRLDGVGNGISLYCVLLRLWLDTRMESIEVLWGESPVSALDLRAR